VTHPLPTLLTTLETAVPVGTLTATGLPGAIVSDRPNPARAILGLVEHAPDVAVDVGPEARPGRGSYTLATRAVTLGKTLVVDPMLPAATPQQNNIPPTIAFGETASPGLATLTASGRVALLTLTTATGQIIILDTPTPLTVAGRAPTVAVPAGAQGTKSPGLGRANLAGRSVTLGRELVRAMNSAQQAGVVRGLPPEIINPRVGWETIELEGAAVWTDID